MSCSKTWKIDGTSVTPHVLEYQEVRSLLTRLENQAEEQQAAIRQHVEGLEGLLPVELLEAVQGVIGAFRPLQAEIDDVFAELTRREPARKAEELLRFSREGRLDLLVEREQRAQQLFASS